MRIALVTHYFPAHRGGIEIVAGELARRLGAEIVWHASDCDPAPSIAGVSCVPAKSWNVVERRLGFPYPLWSPGALGNVQREAGKAEVLHLHDCLYLPQLFAYFAARRAGRPVVVTQHVGMVPFRNPVLRALLAAANRILGRIVLGGATRVVFVSDTVRRYFQQFVRFKSPPLLIANGVDTSVFHPVEERVRARLRAELGVRPDQPLFLFVGRFVEKKGLLMLRELAARTSHARWIFAGWGPLDPEHWSAPNVSVMRGRSGAQLAPLYQAADLLVLPSVGEGFPLVAQEAMACGTPALVGADTAAGVPDAKALLLAEEVTGADALARWEARLRERYDALRKPVAAYAAANWSWDRCAAAYAELFQRCTPK
jgi:glycosyltransferase involved in cell wall biosynthesis